MADLIRTKCGRKPQQGTDTLMFAMLTSYYKACYKNLFSPLAPNSCDFVQNLMGYHSEKTSQPKSS